MSWSQRQKHRAVPGGQQASRRAACRHVYADQRRISEWHAGHHSRDVLFRHPGYHGQLGEAAGVSYTSIADSTTHPPTEADQHPPGTV